MKRVKAEDVARVQQEVLEEARTRTARTQGEGGRRNVLRPAPRVEPVRELEENWDVWRALPLSSHRPAIGPAVVAAKKLMLTLLASHDRELLRRQRLFNEATKNELQQLRQQVTQLRAELRALKRSRSSE
jgi:hypothetical protein